MKKNNTETLTGVPETLLIPLYAKYNETKRNDSIIKDEKAVEIVEKIEKMNYTDSNASNIVWSNQVGIAVRTELLDKATERYLRKNPNAIVVNLGAGLCTRFFRVDNSKLKWYELDLPEVESVWKKVFNETEKHKFLAYDVLDFSWMNELKLIKEKPFLFIAEGLFCYFEEEDVKKTILEIKKNFPNSEMLLEFMSPFVAKKTLNSDVEKTGAKFKWGIKSGKELEKWSDNIKFIEEWYFHDYHRNRWKWMKLFKYVPPLRKMMKVTHIRFKETSIKK